MERKKYTIIYTTIDKQTRDFIWEPINETLETEVIYYLQKGEWSSAASEKSDRNWNADWGLIGPNIYGRTCGYRSLANGIQYGYYRMVLKCITYKLGEECAENPDFAKKILKHALAIAKEKDLKFTEEVRARNPQYLGNNAYQDMLKRAKNHINYAKRKAAEKGNTYYLDVQAGTYANIIEEYGLFDILEILV